MAEAVDHQPGDVGSRRSRAERRPRGDAASDTRAPAIGRGPIRSSRASSGRSSGRPPAPPAPASVAARPISWSTSACRVRAAALLRRQIQAAVARLGVDPEQSGEQRRHLVRSVARRGLSSASSLSRRASAARRDEAGSVSQLLDHRPQRAVAVIGRALVAEAGVRLLGRLRRAAPGQRATCRCRPRRPAGPSDLHRPSPAANARATAPAPVRGRPSAWRSPPAVALRSGFRPGRSATNCEQQ